MEPERPRINPSPAQPRPHLDSRAPRGGGAYTEPPTRPPPKAKAKSTWLAAVAVAGILCVGALGTYNYLETGAHLPTASSATQSHETLTLSGADVDEAATAQAMAAIQSGQANPLVANLTPRERQEVMSGERQFYKLPVLPKTLSATGGDQIQIAVDGAIYATYNTAKGPYTLDVPLKFGDTVAVTCLELAPGKSSVTVSLGTMLNPVQAELAQGQSKNFSVASGGKAQDYGWFKTQANNGNAVAEYGLGHMYQYGIGVPQDIRQAIHWYEMAASQNYRDARQRLAELGQ